MSAVGEDGELPAGAKYSVAGAPGLLAGGEVEQSGARLPSQDWRSQGTLPAVTLRQLMGWTPSPGQAGPLADMLWSGTESRPLWASIVERFSWNSYLSRMALRLHARNPAPRLGGLILSSLGNQKTVTHRSKIGELYSLGGVSKKAPSGLTCAGARRTGRGTAGTQWQAVSASPPGEVVHCVLLPALPSAGPGHFAVADAATPSRVHICAQGMTLLYSGSMGKKVHNPSHAMALGELRKASRSGLGGGHWRSQAVPHPASVNRPWWVPSRPQAHP
nr:uncharacterized protein LOC107401688 [Peromyscus maniculatus bairdii]